MSAKRVFFGMIGTLAIVIVAGIIGLVFGDQMLQQQSNKLVNLKQQSIVLDKQQIALQQAKQDVTKYASLNTIAETIVPQDKDQALTVREIVDFAAQAGISIGSLTFPASNLGTPKVIAPGVPVQSSPSQVVPVAGLSGVYQMPITVQSDVKSPISFSQLISFLEDLENNRHTAQVSQLTITPADASGNHLSFQLIINVYIKP